MVTNKWKFILRYKKKYGSNEIYSNFHRIKINGLKSKYNYNHYGIIGIDGSNHPKLVGRKTLKLIINPTWPTKISLEILFSIKYSWGALPLY